MKKLKKYIIILFCLPICSHTVTAKIWRVNSNAGMFDNTAIFQTIQGAVDAAAKKDTIHIEGAVAVYNETVTVAKRLCIFGPGFELTANPETQHIKLPAKVTNFNFAAGSGQSVLAGIEQNAAANKIAVNADSVKIMNCRLYWVEIQNSKALQNIDIRKNWIQGGKITTSGAFTVNNLNITNNFMGGSSVNFDVINLHADTKALIANNTFYGGFRITTANTGTRVNNNVFFNVNGSSMNAPSSPDQYNRNLYNTGNFGGMITGQYNNIMPSQLAVLDWFSGSGGASTVDRYFTAKEGANSPIRDAAASAGEQLGMYGGMSPYVLSGMTNIPSVYEIVMPAEVSSDGFDVTVKVKAH
jgi:hypothetical protein